MQINKTSISQVKQNNQPAFGNRTTEWLGEKILNGKTFKKISDRFEYNRYTMPTTALMSVLYGATILPRYVQATDKYDRREILTRDMLSITAILFFAQAISKGFSEAFAKMSGYVLTNKPAEFANKNVLQKTLEFFKIETSKVHMYNSRELEAKYSGMENYSNGFDDFFKFIKSGKGDLRKIFHGSKATRDLVTDIVGKDIKSITNEEHAGNFFEDTFKKAKGYRKLIAKRTEGLTEADAKKEIAKLEESLVDGAKKVKIGQSYDKLVKVLESNKNSLVTKAKTFNSSFGFLSTFILVPLFMRWIEKFNEKMTKKRIAEEKAKADKVQHPQVENDKTPELNRVMKSAQNSSSTDTKKTFEYFLGEKQS